MTQRVYLPATLTEIARPEPLGPRTGYAVTPELRRRNPEEDNEGLEYEAYTQAVDASLDSLAADPRAPRRRVVVSADLDDEQLAPIESGPSGAVSVTGPVDWQQVAAFHVDDRDAIGPVAETMAGNTTARSELATRALLWYDASERDVLDPMA